MGPSEAALGGLSGKRATYGQETVPLPVRTNPRRRVIATLLGFAAASLEIISAPLAIYYLSVVTGLSYSEVLQLAGVSLIATLWIFQAIGFTAVGIYGSVLVLRKKAQAGAGWIVFGVFEVSFALTFLLVAGLLSAWVGIAAGGVMILGGALNSL